MRHRGYSARLDSLYRRLQRFFSEVNRAHSARYDEKAPRIQKSASVRCAHDEAKSSHGDSGHRTFPKDLLAEGENDK